MKHNHSFNLWQLIDSKMWSMWCASETVVKARSLCGSHKPRCDRAASDDWYEQRRVWGEIKAGWLIPQRFKAAREILKTVKIMMTYFWGTTFAIRLSSWVRVIAHFNPQFMAILVNVMWCSFGESLSALGLLAVQEHQVRSRSPTSCSHQGTHPLILSPREHPAEKTEFSHV